MVLYKVAIRQTTTEIVLLEAESEEEAIAQAEDLGCEPDAEVCRMPFETSTSWAYEVIDRWTK